MKNIAKLLMLTLVAASLASCSSMRKGSCCKGSECEMKKEGKECSMKKEDCKDKKECDLKKEEVKAETTTAPATEVKTETKTTTKKKKK